MTSFEDWASSYDTETEIEAIISAIDGRGRYDNILEVGCGSGRLTQPLKHQLEHRNTRYIALDIVNSLVNQTVEKSGSIGITGSGESIPIQNNMFDLIVDGWALSAQNVKSTISEYSRVIKDSGEVLIVTESWNEIDREDSEYVEALRICDPEHEWPDLECTLWEPIKSEFSTCNRYNIESSYHFDSIRSAVNNFRYHIEEYNNRELSSNQETNLRQYLKNHIDKSGSVVLSEHAVIFHCYI